MKQLIEFTSGISDLETQEIVANYFDCPVCNRKAASSSICMPLSFWFDTHDNFWCEKCSAVFKLIDKYKGSTGLEFTLEKE